MPTAQAPAHEYRGNVPCCISLNQRCRPCSDETAFHAYQTRAAYIKRIGQRLRMLRLCHVPNSRHGHFPTFRICACQRPRVRQP